MEITREEANFIRIALENRAMHLEDKGNAEVADTYWSLAARFED